jgi:hypothetical protein
MEMTNSGQIAERLFYFTSDGVEDLSKPDMSQIINAVKSLDGIDIDTVSVTLCNGDSMDIGGGKDDQYKCHARTCGSFYDMVNPDTLCDAKDTVMIMMNQEGNSFPRCCIVSREMVLLAIETFCSSGVLDSRLAWDNTLEYEPL